MKITFRLQKECEPIFKQMAKEAGITTRDMAEIAVYNLVACYLKEHGIKDLDDERTSMLLAKVTDPALTPPDLST